MAACYDINFEQRAVIKFLTKEGERAVNIHNRLCVVYGNAAIARSSVYEWVTKFKAGKNSLQDEPRSGRPNTAVTDATIAHVDEMIQLNRRVRVRDIASALNISTYSVETIVHEHLQYRKICARWVPRSLTEEHKRNRLDISNELVQRYDEQGQAFLHCIVTGDETWLHQFEPETKRQSMQWRHPWSPPPRKFRAVASTSKQMATVFWDKNGILLIEYLPLNQTVNALSYVKTMKKLAASIRRKRPTLQSDQVLLLHDNARPHIADIVKQEITKQKWTVLSHPAYSPDLAPCDFYLFGPLKDSLRGKHFENMDALKNSVRHWIRNTPVDFYTRGMNELLDRWRKCIVTKGDYVEK